MDTQQSDDTNVSTEEVGNTNVSENDQVGSSQASSDQANDGQSQEEDATVEIDGEKVPLEELKSGYMKAKDYTQKTQELAQERKELEEKERAIGRGSTQESKNSEELPDEVKQAVEVLKQAGVATKEDLAMMKAQEEDERRFKNLIESNPELKKHEKALKAIGKTDDRAWEDIVVDYGFIAKDKLQKAKARPVKGFSAPVEQESKSIADMTDEEYEDWKAKNLDNSSSPFIKK